MAHDCLSTWNKLKTLASGIGGSLQKDLNVATQALEDVALESANVAKEVSKEVFNPLAKFTKVFFLDGLFTIFPIT